MRFDVLDTDEVDDGTGSAATAATPGPAPRRYRFTPPPIRTRKVRRLPSLAVHRGPADTLMCCFRKAAAHRQRPP